MFFLIYNEILASDAPGSMADIPKIGNAEISSQPLYLMQWEDHLKDPRVTDCNPSKLTWTVFMNHITTPVNVALSGIFGLLGGLIGRKYPKTTLGLIGGVLITTLLIKKAYHEKHVNYGSQCLQTYHQLTGVQGKKFAPQSCEFGSIPRHFEIFGFPQEELMRDRKISTSNIKYFLEGGGIVVLEICEATKQFIQEFKADDTEENLNRCVLVDRDCKKSDEKSFSSCVLVKDENGQVGVSAILTVMIQHRVCTNLVSYLQVLAEYARTINNNLSGVLSNQHAKEGLLRKLVEYKEN